ncbi:MAG: DNA gyrase subunit A [Alphaproteobacteria bacterium]
MSDQNPPPGQGDSGEEIPRNIGVISITEEMRRSYLDYAMSVIVSRALPDVRDGLKPVHRRILHAMNESSYDWNKPYRKSARVVGEVIGKYHPHGDQAVYDALVRMAQIFSLRLPLIDGQGNFGSVDGDPPAAMRYTEVRLHKVAHSLLEDIDRDTVDFQENYDGSEREPVVLPARFPNLLANGAGGIAVGMATNIPPHNLGEVIDGAIALIDDPGLNVDDLLQIIPGPDFPTGGLILGRAGIRSAYENGRGSIIMRGCVEVEIIRRDREALIISALPYQVNKATMIERIAEYVREKRIEGISDIRDESDRKGMRVVIELKRDAVADIVLNQLYRFTALQTSFGANLVALNGGRPQTLTLLDMLTAFVAFREEVVSRRTKFLLGKARDRAHVLVGLAIAVAHIDEVIRIIRGAKDPQMARAELMGRAWPARDVGPLIALIDDPRHRLEEDDTYRLSQEQARAILELRLQRLTALGREEIADELRKIAVEITDYLDILRSRSRVRTIIKDELIAVREEFATPRRTEIIEGGAELEDEDLIQREDMAVTVTHAGWIKRVPLDTYRSQRRGGKGRSGMATKEEDFVTRLFVANTHTPILFFSSRGIVYKLKVWRLPLSTPQARGKALVNLLPLIKGERITSILPLPEDEERWSEHDVMFATVGGNVRRNKLSDFVQVNRNGKIAMKFDDENEAIVGVQLCSEADDVLLTSAGGQCIRFRVGDVRVFKGRDSRGVRGIRQGKGGRVISMAIVHHFEADSEDRSAYLKMSRAVRGESEDADTVEADVNAAEAGGELSQARYAEMSATEQFILTVSENGYAKRSSSHEYRVTGRGGKGIAAMAVTKRNGPLVASFPVEDSDQILMVSNGGQIIRVPVTGIRIISRGSQGVTVFDTAKGEKVVSVERLNEETEPADDDDSDADRDTNASADGGAQGAEPGGAGEAGDDDTGDTPPSPEDDA